MITTEEYENTYFQWKVFAYKNEKGLRADIIRWSLKVSASFGYAPSKVELILNGPTNDLPIIIESKGTTSYWTEEGLNLDGISHSSFLNSGETRSGVFAIVLEGELSPEKVTLEWADEAEKQMKEYWKGIQLFENKFEIPDPQIMEMLNSCARNILQAREVKDGVYEFQVGPTVYRGLWVVDGHFLLEAAHMMGKREEAYQGILAVLKRARPDGSIQILPNHFKETGIALATFVRQCELMDDDERLKELWPTMLRALEYINNMREEAKKLGPNYKGYDLFPPAFSDGGISGPFPEYTTPLWILIGLKSAYEEGKRLKLKDYQEFYTLYQKIKTNLYQAIERDKKKTIDGISYFSMNMEHREYDRPQSATWALAHAMYPGEIFGPDDSIITDFLALLDTIDNKQGIPEETGWVHDQAIWGYSAMFYAQVWLYAGNPDKAVDYLYAFANHAAPSRVWREEQSLTHSHAAEYCGDMPHNWASAEFIRLVRHLILFEKQGNLEIFPGLPEQWLPQKNKDLILERTPTKYGEVTISFKLLNEGEYEFNFNLEQGNKVPDQIILYWSGDIENSDSTFQKLGHNKWLMNLTSKSVKTVFKSSSFVVK